MTTTVDPRIQRRQPIFPWMFSCSFRIQDARIALTLEAEVREGRGSGRGITHKCPYLTITLRAPNVVTSTAGIKPNEAKFAPSPIPTVAREVQ